MNVKYDWSPLDDRDDLKFRFGRYAVLILNQPLLINPPLLTSIWKDAIFRCTVDGGTDRWFSYLRNNNLPIENTYPDAVSGDFDSIQNETLQDCKDKGVYVVNTPDMDKTDFTKALEVVSSKCNKEIDCFVAIGEHSGRLDQTFSNLNTLFKAKEIFGKDNISGYFLTSNSLTWLLQPGLHSIHIPRSIRSLPNETRWCGILPCAPRRSCVTTQGLKWNLNKSQIEFGGLISSSNTYSGEPVVLIDTDTELFWTMSLGEDTILVNGEHIS